MNPRGGIPFLCVAALCMAACAPARAAEDPAPLLLELSLAPSKDGEPLLLRVDGAPQGLLLPGEATLVPLRAATDDHELRLETADGVHSASLKATAGPKGVRLYQPVADSCTAKPLLQAQGVKEGRWRWQVGVALQPPCQRQGRGWIGDSTVLVRFSATPEAQVYHQKRSGLVFRTIEYQALGKTPKAAVLEPVTSGGAWNVVFFRSAGHLDCLKRYQIGKDKQGIPVLTVENGDPQPIVKVPPGEERDAPVVSCTLTQPQRSSGGAR